MTDHYCYFYDKLGRLTSVIKNGVPWSFYAYDVNGNRVSGNVGRVPFTATYDHQDRLLTYNQSVFSYSANGELVRKELNVATIFNYSYTGDGQLHSVGLPNGSYFQYTLDWKNRRVQIPDGSGNSLEILWEDDHRIAASHSSANQETTSYVYGHSINSPDYMIRNGSKYRFIRDHLGSPKLIVDVLTGAIAQRIDYNEWGAVVADTSPEYNTTSGPVLPG